MHDSGGAMRPEKCYWSLVDFKFVAGKWKYIKFEEFEGVIQVKDTNNQYQIVKRKDIHTAREGLGIYVTPNGTMTKQLKKTSAKVTKWSERLKTSFLNCKESYIGAKTTIFKTIEYILPGTTFTELQCRQLERILYKHLMGKLQLSSKLPLEYKFGPHKFQGAALMEIFILQFICKLSIFLHHANINSQLSTTILVSIEAIQIELGSRFQFFGLQFNDYGHLTPPSWLRHLWHAAWKNNVKIYKVDADIRLPRLNDFALIDRAIQAHVFTKEEIQSINRCRLYLHIFFLSDIVSGNGREVLQEILDNKPLLQRTSQWQWPRQPRPPPKDWDLFNTALHEIWIESETKFLKHPIGQWQHKSHQLYKFVYNNNEDNIFETFTNGSIRRYDRIPGVTRTSSKYKFATQVNQLPQHYMPISVIKLNNDNIVGEAHMDVVTSLQETTITTWDEFIASQNHDIQYLLRFARIHNKGRDIASAIRNRTAVAVTDASVEQMTRTAAISWIISDRKETFRDYGDAGCPKFHGALDSYGSEAFGLLVVLTTVKLVCQYYKVRTGKIIIACDNDSSLDKCIKTEYRAKLSDKYFDLLWTTFDIRKSLKIKIQYKYVAGHQDDVKRNLNLYERLNVECDKRSKYFRTRLERGEIYHQPVYFGNTHWCATLYELRMSYSLKQSINDHILGTRLINKMITRGELTRFSVKVIDWDALDGASKMQTAGERLWLTKFVSGFAATAIQMKYRHQKKKGETQEIFDNDFRRWKEDLCPICKQERETKIHVLTCTSKRVTKLRNKTNNTIYSWFDQQHTDPCISQCFKYVLDHNGTISFEDAMNRYTLCEEYLDAARYQDRIGFDNMLMGRLTKHWKRLQSHYLSLMFPRNRYSAEAWMKRLIYQLYKRMKTLWKNRCDIVHRADGKAVSKRERQALKKEIKQQYALGTQGLRADDRGKLSQPMSAVLAYSIRNQRYWIRTLKNSRIFMEDMENNMFSGMRSIIRRWASLPI